MAVIGCSKDLQGSAVATERDDVERDDVGVDALASRAFDKAPASDIGFFGIPSHPLQFKQFILQ